MSKKITLILVVSIILIIGLLAFYGRLAGPREEAKPEARNKEIKIGMVTDVGGLGDQSFNDAAYRGLKRAKEELGVTINVIESSLPSDYEPNLRSLVDQGYDMIWAIGFMMEDALSTVAEQYPDTKFGIIDTVVDKPNVASVTFKEEEGSYLMGIVAGEMTKSDQVGFIGGMDVPLIRKFESGYRAGFKEVNPKGKVIIGYTGAFDDPGRGKELALTQFRQGADIIYHASGACGVGVIKAAEERGKDYFAIGVDSPQAHLAPDSVITSMVKRVDVGVYNVIKDLVDGKFKAKHYVLGLKENGVGPSDYLHKMAPESVIKKVNEYKQKIINGEIEVPKTREELK